MKNVDLRRLFLQLENGIDHLTQSSFFISKNIGKTIISEMKEDLAHWVGLLNENKISYAEFEDKVKNKKESVQKIFKKSGLNSENSEMMHLPILQFIWTSIYALLLGESINLKKNMVETNFYLFG